MGIYGKYQATCCSDVLVWHLNQFQSITFMVTPIYPHYLNGSIYGYTYSWLPHCSQMATRAHHAGLPQDGTWAESANLAQVITDLRS